MAPTFLVKMERKIEESIYMFLEFPKKKSIYVYTHTYMYILICSHTRFCQLVHITLYQERALKRHFKRERFFVPASGVLSPRLLQAAGFSSLLRGHGQLLQHWASIAKCFLQLWDPAEHAVSSAAARNFSRHLPRDILFVNIISQHCKG